MSRVLFIVGSIRKGSFNRQLAHIAEDLIKDWAEASYLEVDSVPFMNQDIEFPEPEQVAAARRAVAESDAIWIFSPEYNHSIPGGLKNLLDWLSRPLDPADPDRRSAVTGKKVIMTGAGGGKRTEFCRKALFDMLSFIGMEVLDGQGRGFALDRRAFTEGIWEPDDACIEDLKAQADILRKNIQ
jgi:NAD(P)H-dependent FMN reductase